MGSTKTEQALFSCDVNTEVLVIQISNAYSVFASQAASLSAICVHLSPCTGDQLKTNYTDMEKECCLLSHDVTTEV